MAHYAKIGLNSKVIAINVVDDNKILNADGFEDEEVGRQFLENITGWPLWIKCSYNTYKGVNSIEGNALRANYPGLGWIYNEQYDIFHNIQPYTSWTLNIVTGHWEAPILRPTLQQSTYTENNITKHYYLIWNENLRRWEAALETSTTIIKYWDANNSSWIDI